ncbi:hypothetical protein H4R99_000224 [Coemansia sp. RSA 1722]|nr:hypothetical protein H4R99_000224 [Coemansia sp. RSA 1722]
MIRKRKVGNRGNSCSNESINTRSRKRARLESDVIVLDSSDESDQAAKAMAELTTRPEYSASYPQHKRRDEAVALHSSDADNKSGVQRNRRLNRAGSDSTPVCQDRVCSQVLSPKRARKAASTHNAPVANQTNNQNSARSDAGSVVSIDDDSQGVEIVSKPEPKLEQKPETVPQLLVPESPDPTPVSAPGNAKDPSPTVAYGATMMPTPMLTPLTPLSKLELGNVEADPVPGLVAGEIAVADLDFAFSMPFSQTSYRDSHYSPEKPRASVYLDAQEHVVQSIAGLLDTGARAGSAGLDERNTPERMSYLKIFDRILNTVLRFEAHLFSEHECEVMMTFSKLEQHSRYIYTRLFLRKRAWIRVSNIKYSDNVVVEQACRSLCKRLPNCESFLITDSELEDCKDALLLLTTAELKDIAKKRGLKQLTGKTKDVLCEMLAKSTKQRTLTSFFKPKSEENPKARMFELIDEVTKITGPMVQLNPVIAELFERLHMVFFRSISPLGVDQSMKLAVLATIGQIRFPHYTVMRSAGLFSTREDVIQFKKLMEIESKMAELCAASVREVDLQKQGWAIYVEHRDAWTRHVSSLSKATNNKTNVDHGSSGMEYWKRHFTPGYALSRIVERGGRIAANLKRFEDEEQILQSLLSQTTYRLGKRGDWYERLVLLYNTHLRPKKNKADKEAEIQIRQALQRARGMCIRAINDEHVHRVSLHSISRQLRGIEKKLGISEQNHYESPRALLEWREAPERTVYGMKIKNPSRRGPSAWDGDDGVPCSVEALALWRYKEHGYIGVHSENALVTTLFALLFWDIIFHPLPGVLDNEYQNRPLDMHSESFYPSRKELIDDRLEEIAQGRFANRLVLNYNSGQGTSCVGVSWNLTSEQLLTVAEYLGGERLGAICDVLAKEYSVKSSGFPDLCMWNPATREILFAEVKGPTDRLSETQRDWIDILLGIGIDVEVCLVRQGDARDFE